MSSTLSLIPTLSSSSCPVSPISQSPTISSPPSPDLLSEPPPPPSSINAHPMITRSKAGVSKPKVFIASRESNFVGEALQQPQWKSAMNDEYMALLRNNTWTLVTLPPGRRAIGCKWVFKVKEKPDGSIDRYKTRLVAKGFHQQAGFDFNETFSPVVKPTTIQIVLSVAVTQGWSIH